MTDADGLVGHRVVSALMADRHEVVRLSAPGSSAKAGSQDWPKAPTDQAALLQGVEALIATGLAGAEDPGDTAKVEADMIRAAAAAGARRIVAVTSADIYKPAVTVRGSANEATERCDPALLDARARAGLALEAALKPVAGVTAIRCPIVLSPEHPEAMSLIQHLLQSGDLENLPNRLQGVDADDLAQVLASALRAPRSIGHALNVAGPVAIRMEDARAEAQRLYALLTDFHPQGVNVRPTYSYAAVVLDTTRARVILPKRAQTPAWVNLARMVQHYIHAERSAGNLPEVQLAISYTRRALQEAATPLVGMTAVVTGATDGIGRETALMLSRLGARVIATGRNEDAGAALVAAAASRPGAAPVTFLPADLTSQSQLRALAARISEAASELHILINNAGAAFADRHVTEDGLEASFALNTLAPFLLSQLLLPSLQAAPSARIVDLNTNAHRQGRADLDDLQSKNGYHPMQAYATTKLYQSMLTRHLAAELEGTNVAAHSIHPGTVRTDIEMKNGLGIQGASDLGPQARQRMNTRREARRRQMISPQEAASYVVNLAIAPDFAGLNGLYLDKAERVQTFEGAPVSEDAKRLWRICMKLSGLETDLGTQDAG
ncbi:MAG: SDR family NAD(P)-dependent oxidoreductase [Marinibacterium sp.]